MNKFLIYSFLCFQETILQKWDSPRRWGFQFLLALLTLLESNTNILFSRCQIHFYGGVKKQFSNELILFYGYYSAYRKFQANSFSVCLNFRDLVSTKMCGVIERSHFSAHWIRFIARNFYYCLHKFHFSTEIISLDRGKFFDNFSSRRNFNCDVIRYCKFALAKI